MKVEIELPDFVTYFEDEWDDWSELVKVSEKQICDKIINAVIDRYIEGLEGSNLDYKIYDALQTKCNKILKEQTSYIVEKVIDKVAETVLKKKDIVSQMPKKSEINSINKEWEEYFSEMINKAIAKRFK